MAQCSRHQTTLQGLSEHGTAAAAATSSGGGKKIHSLFNQSRIASTACTPLHIQHSEEERRGGGEGGETFGSRVVCKEPGGHNEATALLLKAHRGSDIWNRGKVAGKEGLEYPHVISKEYISLLFLRSLTCFNYSHLPCKTCKSNFFHLRQCQPAQNI